LKVRVVGEDAVGHKVVGPLDLDVVNRLTAGLVDGDDGLPAEAT
jgi:hypothetical protein